MSEENSSSASSGGISFLGVLTVAFIVLKLVGVINWSWWWILSPAWIPLSIVVFILMIVLLVILIVWLIGK